jgi:hypothetical protein
MKKFCQLSDFYRKLFSIREILLFALSTNIINFTAKSSENPWFLILEYDHVRSGYSRQTF